MSIQESGTQFMAEASRSATFNSDAVKCQSTRFSVQAVWVGTIGGSIKLQGTVNGTTWSDIPDTSQTILNSGSYIWDVVSTVPYIRLVTTITSGSCAIGGWITSKEDK